VVSSPAAPAGSGSAAATTIAGTWATGKTYQTTVQPFVTFATDGTWTASDGCNQTHGTWKETAPQALAVTSGPMTMMACDGAPLPGVVSGTHTYKLTDDKLALYDEAGKELAVLVPGAPATAVSSAAAPSS
jgi:heat shock protein HslJ